MEPDKQAGTRGGGNSLTESRRRQTLKDAGWRPDGTDAPNAADAWAVYKQRARAAADAWAIYKQRTRAAADAWAVFYTQRVRTAVSMEKPLRYVVLLGSDGTAAPVRHGNQNQNHELFHRARSGAASHAAQSAYPPWAGANRLASSYGTRQTASDSQATQR